MNTRSLIITSILTAALTLAGTTTRAQEPIAETAHDVESDLTIALELEVDVSDAALSSTVTTATEAEFAKLRDGHGLAAATDAADVVMHVSVWQPEPSALVIDASVEFEGTTLDEQVGVVCMGCDAQEIAAKSLAILPAAIEQAQEARAEQEPPAPKIAADDVEEESAPATPSRRLGPVGYVGIAAGVLGLGGTIAGAVFLHRGKVIEGDPGAPIVDYTDYRPLGVGLLGAGLGVMVVGNVLLGVDLGVLRDRRSGRSNARAQLTGLGVSAEHGAGVTIHGRF